MTKDRERSRNTPDIGTLIADKSGQTSSIYHHALKLIELQQKIRGILPSPLCDNITVANLANNTLTIYTSSAAWAARLRFNIPEILKSLSGEASGDSTIKTIRIKVQPPDNQKTKAEQRLSISPENALLLQNVADSISDPELRESLLRLSKNR